MNELICEMCGSNDIIKQDGLYVCQSCGTKYSVEEARKMMTGETVAVEGTVKIDSSSELDNLYEIARRARDTNNSENALKYYDQILMKDANSWEAQFYVVYYRAMVCKIAEIGTSGVNINNALGSTLQLVKDYVSEGQQEEVILEIYEKTSEIANILFRGAKNWYDGINYNVRGRFKAQYVNHVAPTSHIMFTLGDKLIEIFGDEYTGIAVRSWIQGIDLNKAGPSTNKQLIQIYSEKVKRYQPDFEAPKSGGCYVATCVYGSYDCPEVWTLRRFRDTTLKQSIFGRTFIKCYYATSPTIVKYFGNMKIFNLIFKPLLDKFVNKLQEDGVESTLYIDE